MKHYDKNRRDLRLSDCRETSRQSVELLSGLKALYDAAARDSEAIEEGHIQRVLNDQEWQRGAVG